MDTPRRIKTLQGVVIVIAAIVLLRLFYIQVLDGSYKTNADNNVLRYMVQYPPRGEVYEPKRTLPGTEQRGLRPDGDPARSAAVRHPR